MFPRLWLPVTLVLAVSWMARAAEPIRVQSAFVRVLSEAEIPARDKGVLDQLEVRAGDIVKEGQLLGQLDCEEAAIAVARAKLELQIAERQVQNTLPIRMAEGMLKEAEQSRTQAELTQRIAALKALNDVAVRHAEKSRDASKAELERALQARKAFEKSVSLTEIDRLRLVLERNDLEIEKAKFEKELADLQRQVEDAATAEHDQTVARLKLGVEQATLQKEIDLLTRELKARAVEQAQLQLDRRRLHSPLTGEIVEVHRHRGEWLEAGQRVLRIVRLDRLKVEGFAESRTVNGSLRGSAVRVRVQTSETDKPVTLKGTLTFVSPEVDPVNGQVRVWGEIENPDLLLRPGLPVEMWIDPVSRTATNTGASGNSGVR
jgi:multidrug efflux pump subunit AcrA (membrane-fusion protein)